MISGLGNIKENLRLWMVALLFLLLPFASVYADTVGDTALFTVEENFDSGARSQVQAVLVKSTANLYFYVERDWWNLQVPAKQNEILANFDALSEEFRNKIYPNLTSVFGSEWNPGVDGDSRITILFHAMKENTGGYFRSADEYIELQSPGSNEREMIYLPIVKIEDAQLKVFLAHEFVHLIAFNQKDRLRGVQEEVWLNEARAEYSASMLGYNDTYEGSNLQRRVREFLQKPTDSLVEWQESRYDYAVLNMFFYYAVDHYGITMLSDSLTSKMTGIASLNEALARNGYKEDFSQIFTDWVTALVINNCKINQKHCYLNKNLTTFKINPELIFLPVTGNSSLSVTNITKNWSGNWQKIIGGNGDLKLTFESLPGLIFQVPYVLYEKDGTYSVQAMTVGKVITGSREIMRGEINVKDFGTKYNSLIILPSLQAKIAGFNGLEFTYPYTLAVSIQGNVEEDDPALIQKLLAQIEDLKRQIAAIQLRIGNPQKISCFSLDENLYLGINNKPKVMCLQEFLKSQGSDIYPESLVTGYFGNLTRSAVVRFQKRHSIFQTGFVGLLTRSKINSLIKQ